MHYAQRSSLGNRCISSSSPILFITLAAHSLLLLLCVSPKHEIGRSAPIASRYLVCRSKFSRGPEKSSGISPNHSFYECFYDPINIVSVLGDA